MKKHHLESNAAYQYVRNGFRLRKTDSWAMGELEKLFGREADKLVEAKVLINRRHNHQLAFRVLGTASNLVLRLAEKPAVPFRELHQKCAPSMSMADFQQVLLFLLDFDLIAPRPLEKKPT
jgi:hypothetical protein